MYVKKKITEHRRVISNKWYIVDRNKETENKNKTKKKY